MSDEHVDRAMVEALVERARTDPEAAAELERRMATSWPTRRANPRRPDAARLAEASKQAARARTRGRTRAVAPLYLTEEAGHQVLAGSTPHGMTVTVEDIDQVKALLEEPPTPGWMGAWLRIPNEIVHRARLERFRERTDGPRPDRVLVVVGDSWTQFPCIHTDLVEALHELDPGLALATDCGAGRWAEELSEPERLAEVGALVAEARPDAIILSLGGNDMVGGGQLQDTIRRHPTGTRPEDHLGVAARVRLGQVRARIADVVDTLRRIHPGVRIVLHGYDLPFSHQPSASTLFKGPWIHGPLREQGIDSLLTQTEVVQAHVDRFHRMVAQLVRPLDGVDIVDLRGVAPTANDWRDDLHLGRPALVRAARRILDAVYGAT